MTLKTLLPTPSRAAQEIIVTLVGVLGAAWIISRFPKAQKFVQQNSVVLKDDTDKVLF